MLDSRRRLLDSNALFALKFVQEAQYSPDGRKILEVISRTLEDQQLELFEMSVVDLASGAQTPFKFDGSVKGAKWSPDGRQIGFVGVTGEHERIYVGDATGEGIRALTPIDVGVQGPLSWSPDGSTIAFTRFTRPKPKGWQRITHREYKSEGLGICESLQFDIAAVDVMSGRYTAYDVGPVAATQPMFSPCGRRLLFMGSDSALGFPSLSFSRLKLYTLDLSDGTLTRVLDEGWFIAAFAWSSCGERVIVAGDYRSDLALPTPRLWVVNRDGTQPECRTARFDGNIGSRVHHDMPTWESLTNSYFIPADEHSVYATVLVGGRTEIWRISLTGEERCQSVVSGDRTCVLVDCHSSPGRLLFCASDLNTPWELHEFELKSGEERRLTQLNASVLKGWPSVTTQHLKITSPDGTAFEGWFMKRSSLSGPQPTVMFIHGGPMLATGYAFRFDFHLLAANGFAVLFANFRGSSGYGDAFNRAILGDWGARAFPDHMSAIDTAIEQRLADPERLGVWGPSHGGFATGWIVGHTHRFRAAVAESSAMNFATMYYLSDAADLFSYDLGGRPDEIPDVYRSRSPLTYAPRCRTPTLLIHGEADMRCPITEAEQFYRVLQDVGCETELVRISGMTHVGDSTGPLSARFAQNEALLDWFERHL